MSDTRIPVYDGDDRADRGILYHDNGDGSFSPTAYLVGGTVRPEKGILYTNPILKRITLNNGTGVQYSGGDAVGTGVEIPNVVANAGELVEFMWALAVDRAKVSVSLWLLFFDEAPAGFTDNAVVDISAGDQAKLVGAALDVNTILSTGTNAILRSGSPGLRNVVMRTKSTSLWVVGVPLGNGTTTPTAANAFDLILSFGRL